MMPKGVCPKGFGDGGPGMNLHRQLRPCRELLLGSDDLRPCWLIEPRHEPDGGRAAGIDCDWREAPVGSTWWWEMAERSTLR